MMGLIIGILTILLVLNALFLLLVVLMQLPRKEAGLGVAFGGSAAEALFGAGTGTILTKATTYATTLFLFLCLLLSLLYTSQAYRSRSTVLQQLATQEEPSIQSGTSMISTSSMVSLSNIVNIKEEQTSNSDISTNQPQIPSNME